jgi:two-component system KDP operon response regulator KdpE
MAAKILVVDDDQTLLRFLKEFLEREGFQVLIADAGVKALKVFFDERPDLLLLDVMMPGMDGWEVCARIRELADTPIILLTAKSAESDKLRGFRLGIDDFVVKPFSLAELAARTRAVLHRTLADQETSRRIEIGSLIVDIRRHEASLEDQMLELTPTEFRLLQVLATHQGETVSREDLIEDVWGPNYDPHSGSLRRFVWLLRQKLEGEPEHPKRIVTVRGVGYRLEPSYFDEPSP